MAYDSTKRKAYYETNKEKSKAYREANKEKIKAKSKAYYEANKEKIKAKRKAYYEANKEKTKAYYEATKEKRKAKSKAYNEANKEKRKAYNLAYTLKYKYNMTLEERDRMLKKQNNKCKICKITVHKNKTCKNNTACIDHCHTTNKIRGILCPFCNTGLGYFKDNTESLTNALTYLEEAV